MKRLTHAACGILLASIMTRLTLQDISISILCWAVIWSVISDVDVHIPMMKHRGITHTLIFALFSGAIVIAFGKTPSTEFYAALAMFCVILHILVDSITLSGVALWMPFSTKKVRFPIIGGKIRYDDWAANISIQIIAIIAAIIISS
ncbi:MAG: metal-dependent hydrolase [Methanosarcinales archaeon]|nr:MAG: metal-dependent hydrolase [Methanosarcinales archaeon]